MAFVNPAAVTVGAVDSHHLLGLYRIFNTVELPTLQRPSSPVTNVDIIEVL